MLLRYIVSVPDPDPHPDPHLTRRPGQLRRKLKKIRRARRFFLAPKKYRLLFVIFFAKGSGGGGNIFVFITIFRVQVPSVFRVAYVVCSPVSPSVNSTTIVRNHHRWYGARCFGRAVDQLRNYT